MPGDTIDALSFWHWLPWSLVLWLATVAILVVIGTALGWLIAALRRGPEAALLAAGRGLRDAAQDVTYLSPRRVLALTWLTVKESIRCRVVVVFALFILFVLFAGWFLDPGSSDPARLYISFVLDMTRYLVLLLALLLSAVSLPTDIKKRTLHTVVTKPVRRSEIVLGRMLGFAAVGTALLLIMGPISYLFVVRWLSHTHQLLPADLEMAETRWNSPPGESTPPGPLTLHTTIDHGHQHPIKIEPRPRAGRDGRHAGQFPDEGRLKTEIGGGHWHVFSYEMQEESAGAAGAHLESSIGPARDMLVARVPVFGTLRFKDRAGRDAEKGVSVGDEWEYRSFIEGGTAMAAIWTFDDRRISADNFPHGLPVEMTIEIYRSYMAKIKEGVRGSLWVRRPGSDDWVWVRTFEAKEFIANVQLIPRQLRTSAGEEIDLFRDLVSDGRVEIRLLCEDPRQYLGVAPHDLYIRAPDASFALNFAKGYLGIWLQMVLIIGFGVMFSTFLSAPIALLSTGTVLLLGMFLKFLRDLAAHRIVGGGPFESGIRMVRQENLVTELEPGLKTTLAQMADRVAEAGLWLIAQVLPDFGKFSFPDDQGHFCVASGFDISADMILKGTLGALGFLLPLFAAGYFFLKAREIAK